LSTKASIIESHVASSKHKSGITKLVQKEKQDANILDAMKKYNELARPKGETLTEEQGRTRQTNQAGLAAIQPGWDYFQQTIQGNMQPQVQLFKAVRLFDPRTICELRPAVHEIDIVASIDFLNDPPLINNLKIELPRYLTKADGIAEDVNVVQWWKTNEADLPHWASAAKLVLLLQPSSAASERVFSIMTSSFGHLKDMALQDYIECSLMLQFNKR